MKRSQKEMEFPKNRLYPNFSKKPYELLSGLNSPLSSHPRKAASSIRIFHARSVRITLSCAGALRAVNNAVRIGASFRGHLDCN